MTDPISDMLTRIRNAQMAGHALVRIPRSNMKAAIAEILAREGYVTSVKEVAGDRFGELELALKYDEHKKPHIREVKRVSKPGRRIYANVKALPRVFSDLGIAVVSTPSGLMTNKEARRQKLGGEILFTIF